MMDEIKWTQVDQDGFRYVAEVDGVTYTVRALELFLWRWSTEAPGKYHHEHSDEKSKAEAFAQVERDIADRRKRS